MDINMYHAESNTPAMARTSNLNKKLGMVSYIFTDKTGTLTKNVMEFKRCSIAGKMYELPTPPENDVELNEIDCELVKDIFQGRLVKSASESSKHSNILNEFMVMLSVCHTVIPEKINDVIVYHAASPGNRLITYSISFM